jgi:precorrin-2/cobalt-factor-2 C20-methyltransferase
LLDRLRQQYPNLPVEVVPGVSSVNAAAAAAQVPLARGDERVAILPATSENVEDALRAFDTIVLLKVNRSFDALLPILERLGLAGRAVLVQRVTTDRQAVVHDLPSLRGQRLDYFSLLIVRK